MEKNMNLPTSRITDVLPDLLLTLGTLLLLSACSAGPGPEEPSTPENDRTQNPDRVELPVETQQALGLQFVHAERRPLARTIRLTGIVRPDARKLAEIRPLTRGRLSAVSATIGDRVQKGQTLALYDDIELGDLIAQRAAAASYLKQAQSEAEVARQALDRARELVDIGALSRAEKERRQANYDQALSRIDEARTAVGQLDQKMTRLGRSPGALEPPNSAASGSSPLPVSPLIAPLSGVVTAAEASEGEVIEPSDVLFRIADLSTLWVQGNLHEEDIGLLHQGMPVRVTVVAYPSRSFRGTITYISDLLDPDSRTAPVRCEIPNPGWILKLGMFASVEIRVDEGRSTLAVPAAALQTVDGESVVFVRESPTRFESHRVRAGEEGDGWVEILDGLSEGDEVVGEGSFQIKAALLRGSLAEEDD
jgi:cobalt-zinc-cadmium efflux system membrane fusion protein